MWKTHFENNGRMLIHRCGEIAVCTDLALSSAKAFKNGEIIASYDITDFKVSEYADLINTIFNN